jgi:hypothetical protein
MKIESSRKSGAALVIALGFLSVLTIIVVAFTAQTRTERLSGRDFLHAARNRHLLDTALARAMEEIDLHTKGQDYPPFSAFATKGEESLAASIHFSVEEAFIPGSGSPLFEAYESAFRNAAWETVSDNNGQVAGRIGYVVLNTSGLLDANHAGGYYTDRKGNIEFNERKRGWSPSEIQLPSTLLEEFTQTGIKRFPLHHLKNGALKTSRTQPNDPSLHQGLALVYNRENAWRRFETLRDLHRLNQFSDPTSGYVGTFASRPENFRTGSFFPPGRDDRKPIGSTTRETAESTGEILAALKAVGIRGENAAFVLQQFKDYIDTDLIADDPIYSVEPVPLINEILLTNNFVFTPLIETVETETGEDEDGGTTTEDQVVGISVTNYSGLVVEMWYPFLNTKNEETYFIRIENAETDLPTTLFPDVNEAWIAQEAELPGPWNYNDFSITPPIEAIASGTDTNNPGQPYYYTEEGISNAFDIANTLNIDQLRFVLVDSHGKEVDRAQNLELPIGDASDYLLSNATAIAEFFFHDPDGPSVSQTNFTLKVGAATIDPRLNWDGQNTNHWVSTGHAWGSDESLDGANALPTVHAQALPEDEPTNRIHVRNEGIIDSIFEFTYFLCDTNRPWHTIQFFPENELEGTTTHRLAELLKTGHHPPARNGLINPNSQNANVIASTFYRMPVDETVQDDFSGVRRLDENEAIGLAETMINARTYAKPSDLADKLEYGKVRNLIGGNTWENESVLRNAMELFNPYDSTFTILLAAQSGRDANSDNALSSEEIRSTRKAVAQVWRDPLTGKAACVFWGDGETLQDSFVTSDWRKLLEAFNPSL